MTVQRFSPTHYPVFSTYKAPLLRPPNNLSHRCQLLRYPIQSTLLSPTSSCCPRLSSTFRSQIPFKIFRTKQSSSSSAHGPKLFIWPVDKLPYRIYMYTRTEKGHRFYCRIPSFTSLVRYNRSDFWLPRLAVDEREESVGGENRVMNDTCQPKFLANLSLPNVLTTRAHLVRTS